MLSCPDSSVQEVDPYQRPFDDIGIDHELIRLGQRETMVATAQLHPLYGPQRSAPIAPYRKRPRPKRAALHGADSVRNARFAKLRLVPISPLTPTITSSETRLLSARIFCGASVML
jgi:hypothetical protein